MADEDRVHKLVAAWRLAQAAGTLLSLDVLCGGNTELAAAVAAAILATGTPGSFAQPAASHAPTISVRLPKNLSSITLDTPQAETAGDAPPGFLIERELGIGGMGIVYLARQVGLNRPVALKLMKGGNTVEAKALIRFLAEAEAVASVKHPNVVEVYQYGDYAGKPYMALEYCPGGDLTSLTRATTTRDADWYRKVADLMLKVAEGVNAAHAQGIVHRDLKPHNVFLAADGTPKVADFGLAKRGIGSDLTKTDAILGTPAYMAPEQASGGTKFVGPEADVWALGVMLYELCCGERPIDTSGPMLVALARVANPVIPPLRGQRPTVPPDLALIAHKCLNPDPRDRYPTAGALARDLRNWLDGKPITARPTGVLEQAVKWTKRNKKLASLGMAVFLTMATATIVSVGFGLEANKQADRATSENIKAVAAFARATDAETDATKKADRLAAELIESRRILDLARLREAELLFDRNAVQVARDKLTEIAPQNRCIAWAFLNWKCEGSELTLRGHTGGVWGVAISPDGQWIATGSDDKTVRIWDAFTGECLRQLDGTASVSDVAFSPNSRWVAGAMEDGTVRLWDAASGQRGIELIGHTKEVRAVAFSPDGSRIATASYDNTVRLWKVSDGACVSTLTGHSSWVSSVAFSPDGKKVVTACGDTNVKGPGEVWIWDVQRGKKTLEFQGLAAGVTSVAFCPDGKRVAVGSFDTSARVFDAATGRSLVEMKRPSTSRVAYSVSCVAFSPDGTEVAAGMQEGVLVWFTDTGDTVLELKGHAHGVERVAYAPDGRRLVTASWGERTARVWDATDGRYQAKLWGHTDYIASTVISQDGRRVATGARDKTARVWDADTGESLVVLKGHSEEILSVDIRANGLQVVSGSADHTARVWDVTTGRCQHILQGHTDKVVKVAYSPDGQQVATGSEDHSARVWDAISGRPLVVFKQHTDQVTSVAFSPDQKRLATASRDGRVLVWNLQNPDVIVEFNRHNQGATDVAFSPDGTRIVTSSGDGTVCVWDLAAPEKPITVMKDAEFVYSVLFSLDGRRIISSSLNHSQVWDTATGQRLIELTRLGRITRMALVSERLRIASYGMIWEGNVHDNRPGNLASVAERAWQKRSTKPSPQYHASLVDGYKEKPFVVAVQRSLEQRAYGQLAFEANDFTKAWMHFIAAEILRPKPSTK